MASKPKLELDEGLDEGGDDEGDGDGVQIDEDDIKHDNDIDMIDGGGDCDKKGEGIIQKAENDSIKKEEKEDLEFHVELDYDYDDARWAAQYNALRDAKSDTTVWSATGDVLLFGVGFYDWCWISD